MRLLRIVRNRYLATLLENVQAVVRFNTMANAQLDRDKVRTIGRAVIEHRYGVCTTFAIAAANILLDDDVFEFHRIEIVSGEAHCFVIIDRSVDVDNDGPFSFKWETARGSEYPPIVVDPWLGSMGHPSVFARREEYPPHLLGLLENLAVKFKRLPG